MSIYWVVIVSIACHIIMALYACLLVKDSFKLALKAKRPLMLLSCLVPLFGSALAIAMCGNGKKSSVNTAGVFIGGEHSNSSGCEGGGGGE